MSCWATDNAQQGTNAHNFGATCWSEQLKKYQGIVKDMSDKPMGCSEYSAGLFNYAYDGVVAAAFIFKNVPLMNTMPWVSFWAVSDVFAEGGMRFTEFMDQFGMQTLHGVAKPVFRAFELLRHAGNYTIPLEIDDPSAEGSLSAFATVATATGTAAATAGDAVAALRGLRIFIANFKPNVGLPQRDSSVTIRLAGLASLVGANTFADVKVTAHVIDATHANPKALWQGMGKAAILTLRAST